MVNTDLAALVQSKANERKAIEYSNKVRRQRKLRKAKKVVTGILVTAFFIAGIGAVGKNDLESEGIVLAKETESFQELTRNGKIRYKNLIETEEGYLWKADINFPEGTEVTVLFSDNGTTNPIDDIVLDVTERR